MDSRNVENKTPASGEPAGVFLKVLRFISRRQPEQISSILN